MRGDWNYSLSPPMKQGWLCFSHVFSHLVRSIILCGRSYHHYTYFRDEETESYWTNLSSLVKRMRKKFVFVLAAGITLLHNLNIKGYDLIVPPYHKNKEMGCRTCKHGAWQQWYLCKFCLIYLLEGYFPAKLRLHSAVSKQDVALHRTLTSKEKYIQRPYSAGSNSIENKFR